MISSVNILSKRFSSYICLNSTNNAQRESEDEGIKHGRNWLENGNVLHKGSVPRETENEGRDENVKNEEEKLGEHVRLGLRLGDFVNNLHFTY